MTILTGIRRNFSDTAVLSRRMMRHTFRSVDTIITVVAMPIVMMLLFVFVFGGAMNTGSIDYVNFLVPGIVLFTVASGVSYSAVHLNNDITAGIFDRFYSMPISKSSILGGHVLNSVVFNMFSVALVLLVAFVIGFRPHAGPGAWLLAIGLVLLFTFAMTWVAVTFGLLAGSAEGAGVFAYPMLCLLFISAAFVPAESMSGVLRVFAENQPMTPIIEAVRSLLMGQPVGSNVLIAVVWWVVILITAYVAAMRIYKRKTA